LANLSFFLAKIFTAAAEPKGAKFAWPNPEKKQGEIAAHRSIVCGGGEKLKLLGANKSKLIPQSSRRSFIVYQQCNLNFLND